MGTELASRPAPARFGDGIPLIPRAVIFGNPSRFQARLSPDGAWLTWLAPFEGVLNVWLAPADRVAAAQPLTRRKGRPIAWHDWSWDGRHVMFMSDQDGDVELRGKAAQPLQRLIILVVDGLPVAPGRPDHLEDVDRDQRHGLTLCAGVEHPVADELQPVLVHPGPRRRYVNAGACSHVKAKELFAARAQPPRVVLKR